MSIPRFREPAGVSQEYWDLADERGPFWSYGQADGPHLYWRQVKDRLPAERDLNWYGAWLLASRPRDQWRELQGSIIQCLQDVGPEQAKRAIWFVMQGADA